MNPKAKVVVRGMLAALGTLLMATLVFAGQEGPARLKLLKQFSYEGDALMDTRASMIAFARSHIYLSSPDGKVLETDALTPSSELRTIFQPPASFINGLYVFDDVLYVPVRPRPGYLDHTLFQSKDRGQTFLPIDNGLAYCVCGICGYLQPTQVYARGNLVYVSAGGGENLFVTADEGETYRRLSGQATPTACSDSPFDIFGTTVLFGGKCGMGNAFFWRGVLSPDGQSLAEHFEDAVVPSFDGRKINVVRVDPSTSLVYAALEGRLLRSADDGKSFTPVYDYPVGAALYRYVAAIAFSVDRDLTIVGGWNKGSVNNEKPLLAYARKKGAEWTDISELLTHIPKGMVTDLKEDQGGRMIAVVVDPVNKTVLIYHLQIANPDAAE